MDEGRVTMYEITLFYRPCDGIPVCPEYFRPYPDMPDGGERLPDLEEARALARHLITQSEPYFSRPTQLYARIYGVEGTDHAEEVRATESLTLS